MTTGAAVIVTSACLLAITSVPYLYAAWSSPDDLVYTGLMFDVPDHAQYWSWVTASRHGLFISNTMTPEPNPPIFMNPMMWLLARLQVLFDLSFPALFQIWRIGATLLLVAALLTFLRAVVRDAEHRRTALLISLIGSGLGWLLVVAKKLTGAADVRWPLDLYTVEPNTFWGLLAYPYLPFGQALLLFTITGAWLAREGNRWAFVLAGLGSLALALTHAYDLIVVYTVLAAFGVFSWIRTKTFPRDLLLVGTVIVACSAPVALYYRNLTAYDPLWRSILAQYANAGVWTPRHLHLVILMGAPLLLAAGGLFRPRPQDEAHWLVSVWAVVGLGLIYLPMVYQIKLLAGWQFPLAVLAAHAWHDRLVPSFDPMAQTARRFSGWPVSSLTLSRVVLVLLILPTNAYLFAWRFVELRRHQSPYYLHRDEIAVLDWLAEQGRGREVVLAPPAIGQFVPNYGESRAYLAHWAMTNRYYERADNVEQFFSRDTTDDWRDRLLNRERVTMVLRSGTPAELEVLYDPSTSRLFRQVMMLPRAQLYRVWRSSDSKTADGRRIPSPRIENP